MQFARTLMTQQTTCKGTHKRYDKTVCMLTQQTASKRSKLSVYRKLLSFVSSTLLKN